MNEFDEKLSTLLTTLTLIFLGVLVTGLGTLAYLILI